MPSLILICLFLVRFRWVALQLQELSTCYSDYDLQEQLGKLPTTLPETYRKIILKIPQKQKKDVLKFLQWLAFSFKPLQAKKLAQITGINMDYIVGSPKPPFNHEAVYRNPTSLINVCAGLVIQSKGGYWTICNEHSILICPSQTLSNWHTSQ
jgi:hypothetical protein